MVHDPTGLVMRGNKIRPDLEDLHDPKWSEAVDPFFDPIIRGLKPTDKISCPAGTGEEGGASTQEL